MKYLMALPGIESLESRAYFAATAARPAYNTGTGFYVVGTDIFDANGQQFVMRGLNHTTWWGNGANNLLALDQFSKTGANAVRTVFGTDFGVSQTPAQRQYIAEQLIKNKIVPVVEDHMGTVLEDQASLDAIVDRWLDPANVSWLKKNEKYVILNIANEWGPDSELWRDAYISNIARIRNAGINALIMVDAGLKGQSMHTISAWAKDVQAADPQHNVVFSIHLYEFWRTGNAAGDVGTIDPATGLPWDIATEMQKGKSDGIPLICGEFSWKEAEFVTYDTRTAIQTFNNLDMGWLAWSWNQNDDTRLNILANSTAYQYNSSADLSTYGKLIIDDPALGLKATAKQATVFSNATGSISGVTFNDNNANGKLDSGEAKTAGKTVYLDSNLNNQLDAGEVSVITDSSGGFKFSNLAPGNYQVRRAFPTGYTYSTSLINITLAAGQQITGQLIGSKAGTTPGGGGGTTTKGSITGYLFFDYNKNGIFDKSDTYQSGKIVFIDTDGDGLLDVNETKTTTDSKGVFTFGNLPAGAYKIRRTIPAGYKLTTPIRNITLSTAQNATGVTIGTAYI